MLQNIKSKREQGFTIIEVLIVLAIAGLIMVVVFLAVPALQRNSRNNSRTTDVNNLSSAVSEYQSNNGGALPADADALATAVKNTKLGFYTGSTMVAYKDGGTAAVAAVTDADKTVQVVMSAKCDGDKTAPGSSRQFAILFAVESGSGTVSRCQDS